MLADGLYEFLRESFPDHQIDKLAANGLITINAFARPVVTVKIDGHMVAIWRERGELGSYTRSFMVKYNLHQGADYWYETGGLKFDLRQPDSLEWLRDGAKAILDDHEEMLRRIHCQDGSQIVAILAS